MHIRYTLDYARRRMKELKIQHWRWEERFIRFPLVPGLGVNTYEFFSSNYWYLTDNWIQPRVFYDMSAENNLQILGDYSYRRFQGNSRVLSQKGINEFYGRIQFRYEILTTTSTESNIVIPFIEVIPILAS